MEKENINQIIIHVDMDAFFASVEVRDDPRLKGKPLIIGALPSERGVVATCSYEARKYGIHSAMNIKDAYKACPKGIYKRPNMEKYRHVSNILRSIWKSYTPLVETVALDEAYLDVTEQAKNFEEARKIAALIKKRIKQETGLTCSVGLAYSKTAAKTASEERKPNGYFEIKTPKDFIDLIIDRDVRAIHTVGEKTAQKLNSLGIKKVRDIQNNEEAVKRLLGKQGELVTNFSKGIDNRKVVPYRPQDAKSLSREVTFQENVTDFELLKDILLLLSLCVENRAQRYDLYGTGVTLKITYSNMKSITRSQQIFATNSAILIWKEAVKMLEKVDHHSIRLIGVGIHNLVGDQGRQITIEDLLPNNSISREKELKEILRTMQDRYGLKFADNIDKIFKADVLHRTIEYMRKHKK